jgi:hypothetical protein
MSKSRMPDQTSDENLEHDFDKELASAGVSVDSDQKEAAVASPAPTRQETRAVPADKTLYANYCNVTATPEEVMLDFSHEPNLLPTLLAGRKVSPEIECRVVMSYQGAKRMALILSETLRQFEERFGAVELDPRKRLKQSAS